MDKRNGKHPAVWKEWVADIYLPGKGGGGKRDTKKHGRRGGKCNLASVISTGARAKVTPTHQPKYTWDIVGGAQGIRIRVWKGYYPGVILIIKKKMGDGFLEIVNTRSIEQNTHFCSAKTPTTWAHSPHLKENSYLDTLIFIREEMISLLLLWFSISG